MAAAYLYYPSEMAGIRSINGSVSAQLIALVGRKHHRPSSIYETFINGRHSP